MPAAYTANFNSNPYGAESGRPGVEVRSRSARMWSTWLRSPRPNTREGANLAVLPGFSRPIPRLGRSADIRRRRYFPPSFTNTMLGASGNPNFSNSISPDSWNQIAAGLRAQQNLNTYAGPGIGSIGASGGFGYPAFGGAFSNPGPGSSAWDPQNTAYNMLFRNQISPQLGAANLSRVSDFGIRRDSLEIRMPVRPWPALRSRSPAAAIRSPLTHLRAQAGCSNG